MSRAAFPFSPLGNVQAFVSNVSSFHAASHLSESLAPVVYFRPTFPLNILRYHCLRFCTNSPVGNSCDDKENACNSCSFIIHLISFINFCISRPSICFRNSYSQQLKGIMALRIPRDEVFEGLFCFILLL